jgi:capsular exopolysaccharide synthesis family protein
LVLHALRRWWVVATPIGLLLATIVGAVMYARFEPLWEAEAWFRIEERAPYLAFQTKDEGPSKTFFQTQIETIRSPLVLDPVIKQPEIAQMPEIGRQADKIAWLAKQIKVTPVGESELFRIVYAGRDPRAAAGVVNAVTEAYFAIRDQSDAERDRRVIETLMREQDKRSKEVSRLRDHVRALAKQATIKNPFAGKIEADGATRHPLADLEGRLISVQVERTVLEARLKAVEEQFAAKKPPDSAAAQNATSTPQDVALRDVMAERLLDETAEVQRQRALIAVKQANLKATEERSAKGRQDPLYVRLTQAIRSDEETLDQLRSELRPRVRREVELAIANKRMELDVSRVDKRREDLVKLRSDYEGCRVMEQMLNARYEQQRKSVEQSSGDTMELTFKADELTRAEKVFELIAQRALQLETERGAPSRVTLMRAAEPPLSPQSFPYPKIAMAMLAGFCLPFALAVLWERQVGRVVDARSLEQQSSLAMLGEITYVPTRTLLPHDSADARLGYESRLFEESIDSLRTSLTLSDHMSEMRVLAVTSAVNHEGKTSVAVQLAISLARSTREPLLLIDGDMRSPDVHRVFQAPLEPGLAMVLAGACTLEEAIVTNASADIHLLPAGRLRVSPHQLLGNGTWKALLARIPTRYRYVVIDTPPVLAASEAIVLANGADVAVVCAMRGMSRMDQIRKTIERLAATGCRPVGTVLSGVPTRYYASRYGDYTQV